MENIPQQKIEKIMEHSEALVAKFFLPLGFCRHLI